MHRVLLITILLIIHFCTNAQDSLDTSAKKGPSKFSLGFGLSYSIMGFETRPYFIDSSGKAGKSEIKNVVGVSASAGYMFQVSPRLMIRPSVEAHMMPAKISYDTEIDHKTISEVYPISVEIPIAAVYNLSSKPNSPTAQLAFRPVYAPETFSDPRPEINPFNLNLDIGVGMPFQIKKALVRMELYYSHGFLELIGENPDDYKTRSVKHLTRSFAGIRFYLN